MRVVVLSSSSKGNSTFIEINNIKFLIDAGLGFGDIKDKLYEIGVSADEFTKTYLGLDTTTKGVKSTSYDEGRAGAFANGQGGYIIEYHVKPGNHGADVNGVPGANEREFLIRNGMKQKVITKPDKKKLIVEIG